MDNDYLSIESVILSTALLQHLILPPYLSSSLSETFCLKRVKLLWEIVTCKTQVGSCCSYEVPFGMFLHAVALFTNLHVVCPAQQNILPGTGETADVVIYVDSVSIVCQSASPGSPPLAIPVACVEVGEDHKLPSLALRLSFNPVSPLSR